MGLEEKVTLTLKDKFSKTAGKVTKSIGSVTSAFTSLRGLLAGAAITGAIVKVSRAFIEQENAVNKLNVALRANPAITQGASKRLQDFATSLQQVTTFGDEAILAQQAFLASLKLSESQINSIISAAVDLSAATGLTLESAVRNLTKTTSGLQGELGELIPQLKDLTAEQLKAGKGIEVIAELFEGQAQAATVTFGGQIQQLSNNFGDLQETLGKLVSEGANGGLLGLFNSAITELNIALGGGTGVQKLDREIASITKELAKLQAQRRELAEMPETSGFFGIPFAREKQLAQLDKEIDALQKKLDARVGEKSDMQAKLRDKGPGKALADGFKQATEEVEEKADLTLDNLLKFAENSVSGLEKIKEGGTEAAKGLGESFINSIALVNSSFAQMAPQAIAAFGAIMTAAEGLATVLGGRTATQFEKITNEISKINSEVAKAFDLLNKLRGEEEKIKKGSVRIVDRESAEFKRFKEEIENELPWAAGFSGLPGDIRLETNAQGDIVLTVGGRQLGVKRGDTGEFIFNVPASYQQEAVRRFINQFGGTLRQPEDEGFALGGLVAGNGRGMTDSLRARLTEGEFVVSRRGVNAKTLGMLRRLNSGADVDTNPSSITINALDSQSFEEFLRRRGARIMRTLSRTEGLILSDNRGVRGY